MAEKIIEIAKEHGIAIVFGGNHNDAGSFGAYAWLAYEQDCLALTANNSVPMCSPLGGMGNVVQVGPLDGIAPGGEEPPVWMSTKLCEWYDADTAQAVLQGTKLKGDYVIDPETGERLWSCRGIQDYVVPCVVADGETVYCSGGRSNKCFVVRAGGRGDVS